MIAIAVLVYVVAAALSSLTISILGEQGVYLSALIAIPLFIVSQDVLHERWRNDVWPRMLPLIVLGAVIHALATQDDVEAMLKYYTSFAFAGTANAISYHRLLAKPKLLKISAASFVALAVHSILISIMLLHQSTWAIFTQTMIKFVGGYAWTTLAIKFKAFQKSKK